jgi:hypothetical protein
MLRVSGWSDLVCPSYELALLGVADTVLRWTKLVVGHPFDTIKVSTAQLRAVSENATDAQTRRMSASNRVQAGHTDRSPMYTARNIRRRMACVHDDDTQRGELLPSLLVADGLTWI